MEQQQQSDDTTTTNSATSGEYSPASDDGSISSSSLTSESSSSTSMSFTVAAGTSEAAAALDDEADEEELARQQPPVAPAEQPQPPRHYHHHHAHAHAHSHSHSHSAPPPPVPAPTPNPPHHLPPPANPNNLRPIQAHRQRAVRVPLQAMPQQNQNSNQLGAVRDRLFQAMLVRMALWYTARVNRTWRKVIELVAITLAILSFLSLAIVHAMFMRVSTSCLKDLESTWPRDGIVRVELVRNLAMLRKKNDQFKEYRKQHLEEMARMPPPVCRFSIKEVLQRGPAVLPAEIREFGYLASHKRESQKKEKQSIFGTVIGYIYPDLFDEEEETKEYEEDWEPEPVAIENEHELMMIFENEFNSFYDPDELPHYEYRVEYSLIYGLLRLPARFLKTHNVSVMATQIDADDSCLGSTSARWLMANVVGYEDPILHTLKALAINESEIGYVHDLRSNDHYHFVQLATSKMSYVTAGIVMLLFPLAFPAAPLLTVILALVGMEAIMSEVFNDTTTAFYVILIVWLADQFDAICCQSPTSKRYWLRFFFLHQFFFYSYQYRFGGVYGGLALLTSSLFILHSMIFFFHHYEIPLILYTDRLQRIMNELNGRMPMADPPVVQEVNLATGPNQNGGEEGGAGFNRAVGTPPHAVNGIRRVVLPRNGPQRPMIGIPLNQPGRPIEHGMEDRMGRRTRHPDEGPPLEGTWIRSIARSVGGRLVNTIPSWMVGGEQQIDNRVVDQGERIRFRLPRGTGTVQQERRNPQEVAPEFAADE